MEATRVELEAIQIRFRAQNPDAPEGAVPTRGQAERLLREIRVNQARIERSALEMLFMATKNSPSYSGNRSKYMQLLFAALLIFAVGGGAVYLLVMLVTWLLRIRL